MLDTAATEFGLVVHTVSNTVFGEILSEASDLSG
jgi:hypothetical protein